MNKTALVPLLKKLELQQKAESGMQVDVHQIRYGDYTKVQIDISLKFYTSGEDKLIELFIIDKIRDIFKEYNLETYGYVTMTEDRYIVSSSVLLENLE